MGLRDRVRKTFKKKDGSCSGGSTPSTSSDPKHYTGRTDIEYYKPHEIPKSKYRGKVDPGHQEKLDAYSFADAFTTVKRKSSQALSGIMSPGGTKSQSRRPSYMSHVSKTSRDGRKSIASIAPGTQHVLSPPSRQVSVAGNLSAPLIRENSDDDTNVENAGLSRYETVKAEAEEIETKMPVPEIRLQRQSTVADQPFTADELEKAMTRATLRGNQDLLGQSSTVIAAH